MNRAPLLFMISLLAGCAVTPDGAVEEARMTYSEVNRDPQVRRHAPARLGQAEAALRKAEQADSEAERQHQAYLSRRYAELATLEAQRRMTRLESERLARTRDRLRQYSAEFAALEARSTEHGWLMTLDDILFETGGATIKPGASDRLQDLVRFLKRHPETAVRVEGHTDATGSASRNQRLSEQRANSVRDAIVSQGIDPQRVRTRGYGERRPVADNQTAAGRQLNRRVDVLLLAGDRVAG